MKFECKEDGVMPIEFEEALSAGKSIFCLTGIGWIKLDDIESVADFRNSVTYKFE